MAEARAVALATALYAAYPGRSVQEVSVLSAAEDLERAGLDIAVAIVERLRDECPNPPSHFEIQGIARKVREERWRDHEMRTRELPAPISADSWEMSHRDFRAATARLREKWASEEAEQKAAEKQRPERLPLERPASCSGMGKPSVMRDGHAFCPSCGEDICPDCRPVARSLRYAT